MKNRSWKRNLAGKEGAGFTGVSRPNHSPGSGWKPDLLGQLGSKPLKWGARPSPHTHPPTRLLLPKLLLDAFVIWFRFDSGGKVKALVGFLPKRRKAKGEKSSYAGQAVRLLDSGLQEAHFGVKVNICGSVYKIKHI